MREDSLEMLRKHLPDDDKALESLPPSYKDLVVQVRDCYAMQIGNPWISRKAIRMKLCDTYQITESQAYNIIALTAQFLGDVPASHKNWIKIKAETLMEEAYDAATKKNFALAAELRKQAKTLGFLFRLDQDEGELLEAQKYLTIERVEITLDPNEIGVKYSSKDKEKADNYIQKFVEDAEFEDLTDEESLPA